MNTYEMSVNQVQRMPSRFPPIRVAAEVTLLDIHGEAEVTFRAYGDDIPGFGDRFKVSVERVDQ